MSKATSIPALDPELLAKVAIVETWHCRSLLLTNSAHGLMAVAEFVDPAGAIYTGCVNVKIGFGFLAQNLYHHCATAIARGIVRFERKGRGDAGATT